jgi:8-oxo-dGTP pyrophosphatase MutT (NUDIX family)
MNESAMDALAVSSLAADSAGRAAQMLPMLDDLHLPDRLSQRMAARLPGPAARASMAPQLSYGRHEGPAAGDARQAAVLLLLFRAENRWWFPLTVRPDSLTSHAGQVSLPGGQVDPGESAEDAARRELGEELGVDPPDLRFLGRLTPLYVYASNFLVTPCIAATDHRPGFAPNPMEVANLCEGGSCAFPAISLAYASG